MKRSNLTVELFGKPDADRIQLRTPGRHAMMIGRPGMGFLYEGAAPHEVNISNDRTKTVYPVVTLNGEEISGFPRLLAGSRMILEFCSDLKSLKVVFYSKPHRKGKWDEYWSYIQTFEVDRLGG